MCITHFSALFETPFTLYDHLTDCSPSDLWDLSASGLTFLPNVSLLNDSAAQYPSCNDGSVGSVVLNDTEHSTVTVAYFSGITPGSSACFVCENASGYELNTTTERVCQRHGVWSGIPIVCGTYNLYARRFCVVPITHKIVCIHKK